MTLIEILESREEALNVHRVAELLGVSEKHIYELVAQGKLPAFRVGKAIRFDPQDVADWLRRKKRSSERLGPEELQRRKGSKSNRRDQEGWLGHIWRKLSSLEAALAIDGSSNANSMENS